ncbi:MAG TPA: pyridoxal-phosphate dependent enzyme [Pseudonocardiaceae bacterium]|nr:pyridoxal-phosphate dependent enzyme [Pseudonocardiaceae bacterium]
MRRAGSHGIERFAAELPAVERFIWLGEGDTPLVPLPAVAADLGLRGLWAKLESVNPTGSYKDRIAAMSVSLALGQGKAGWIATSSGNAGLAMAAYGARAGLPGFLCLVASAPAGKRRPLVPFGVRTLRVNGVGAGASHVAEGALFAAVREAAARHGLYLGITAHQFNPDGMRGVDTIGFELAEQLPGATHVYVPTGGGGLLAAIGRGLAARGMAARLVACQPSGCAPIVRHLAGELPEPVMAACRSEISALQLPRPPDGRLATAAVRVSGGWGTHVPDESVLTAARTLAAAEGVFVEPAAAAALAAVTDDLRTGRLDRDAEVVLMLTGAGWKDLGRFEPSAEDPVDVVDVPAAVEAWAAA